MGALTLECLTILQNGVGKILNDLALAIFLRVSFDDNPENVLYYITLSTLEYLRIVFCCSRHHFRG